MIHVGSMKALSRNIGKKAILSIIHSFGRIEVYL